MSPEVLQKNKAVYRYRSQIGLTRASNFTVYSGVTLSTYFGILISASENYISNYQTRNRRIKALNIFSDDPRNKQLELLNQDFATSYKLINTEAFLGHIMQ